MPAPHLCLDVPEIGLVIAPGCASCGLRPCLLRALT